MSSFRKMTEDECRTAQGCENEVNSNQTPKNSKTESCTSHLVIKNGSEDIQNGASASTPAKIHYHNSPNGRAQVVANLIHEVSETKSLEHAMTQEPIIGTVSNFCSSTFQVSPSNAPRLPPEIRHMIAEAAVLDPRSLTVEVKLEPQPGEDLRDLRRIGWKLEHRTGKTLDDIASCLGLLRNRERDIALWNNFLERSFETSVFHIILENTCPPAEIMSHHNTEVDVYSPVKHLSINVHDIATQSMDSQNRPTIVTLVRIMQSFPRLRTLSIVLGHGRPQLSKDNIILESLDTSSSQTTPLYRSQGRPLRSEVVQAYMFKNMICNALRKLDQPWVKAEDLQFNIVS